MLESEKKIIFTFLTIYFEKSLHYKIIGKYNQLRKILSYKNQQKAVGGNTKKVLWLASVIKH